MRATVQRVANAKVTVDDRITGQIGRGLLVYVGVAQDDTDDDVAYLVDKISNLRIFNDEQGKMNLSVRDIGGGVLVISAFTLQADAEAHWDMGHEVEGIEEIRDEDAVTAIEAAPPPPSADEAELVSPQDLPPLKEPAEDARRRAPAQSAQPVDRLGYRMTDLSGFKAEPELFYEFAYRDTIKGMIEAVIETEGPLLADVLAQRIARAHGWLRTGGRIRERIDLHLSGYDTTSESSGVFLWKKGSVAETLPYRRPANEESRRAISDIPLAELVSVVIDNPDLFDMPDPARDMARFLGVERLAATSRARLDDAIARARLHIAAWQESTA